MAYIELSNPTKYKAHYNTKVKAIAKTESLSVTLNQPGSGGQIRVIYNGIAYTESFVALKGQDIEILFDLTPGYTLTSFTMNGNNILSGYKTTVNSSIIINATTAIQQYAVQLTNDSHTKINAKCNGRNNYTDFYAYYNDDLTIEVSTTDSGYIVDTITVNGDSVDNGYNMKITKNLAIKATSTKDTLTVNIANTANCTFTVVYNSKRYTNGDTLYVTYGDSISISVTTSTGYTVDRITANGSSISGGSYKISNSTTIAAVISKAIHTVSIVQPENGSITVQENGITHKADFQVPYGTNILILVETVGEDYYLDNLYVNSTSVRNNSYYEITSNVVITATIAQVVHIPEYSIRLNQSTYATITATSGNTAYTTSFTAIEGSDIDIKCNTTVRDYAEITLFTVDSTNYTITDTNSISASLKAITDNHVISCSSKLKDIIMNLSIVNGTIKNVVINSKFQDVKLGKYTVHYKDSISITIEPYSGFLLDSYTEINGMTKNGNVFTFDSYDSGINDFSINFVCIKELTATLTIEQPLNGNIYVVIDGKKYTTNTTVKANTNFDVIIEPYSLPSQGDTARVKATSDDIASISMDKMTVATDTYEVSKDSNATFNVAYNDEDIILTGIKVVQDNPYILQAIVIDGVEYTDTIPEEALTITKDKTITAHFTSPVTMRTVVLDQSKHATLSIPGYDPVAENTYQIPDGTTINVVATPDTGYEVIGINKIQN